MGGGRHEHRDPGGHNLGWKLAWVPRGWAGPTLLDSYEADARPRGGVPRRDGRLQMGGPPERDPLGEDLGVRYASVGNVACGSRGGARAARLGDGRRPPPFHARPLRRPPHAAGRPGRRQGGGPRPTGSRAVLPLTVVDVADALVEYVQGGAVLVRPDGYVAWRAATTECPKAQLRAALDLTLGRVSRRSARAA